MDLLVPIGGFFFVLGSLAALSRIRQGEAWEGAGLLAALGFAAMVWVWALMTAS